MKKSVWIVALLSGMGAVPALWSTDLVAEIQGGHYRYEITVEHAADFLQRYHYFSFLNWTQEDVSNRLMQSLLLPHMLYEYEMNRGLTNKPHWLTNFHPGPDSYSFFALLQEGYRILYQDWAGQKIQTARASHILFRVGSHPDGQEAGYREVEKQAQAVLKELKTSRNLTEDFAARSQEYSQDYSAERGDLGIILPGKLDPDLEKAIFSARGRGLIPSLVRTSQGVHIILITEAVKLRTPRELASLSSSTYYPYEDFEKRFLEDLFSRRVQFHYRITSQGVEVNGGLYTDLRSVPSGAKMFTLDKQVYDWGYGISLLDQHMGKSYADEWSPQTMTEGSLEDLPRRAMFWTLMANTAKGAGVEKRAEFDLLVQRIRLEYLYYEAQRQYWVDLDEEVASRLTDEDLRQYYLENQDSFFYYPEAESESMEEENPELNYPENYNGDAEPAYEDYYQEGSEGYQEDWSGYDENSDSQPEPEDYNEDDYNQPDYDNRVMLSFEEAYDMVKEAYQSEQRALYQQAYRQNLLDQAVIHFYPAGLKKVQAILKK